MRRRIFWSLGFIVLLAVVLTASLGGGLNLTSFPGSKASEGNSPVPEPLSITLWSDQVELFLEYSPLVAGRASAFAVHLTDLRSFQPVITGRVEIRMMTSGKSPVIFSSSAPLRPGIFIHSVTLSEPGTYEMELALKSETLSETFHLSSVKVFPSQNDAEPHIEISKPHGLQEEVTFLKEQQWKTQLITEPVSHQVLASTISARGMIQSKMGQKVVVTSPATGLVVLPPSGRIPVMGQKVKRGEVLVAIAPGLVTASRAELEAAASQRALELKQAQREWLRARHLHKEKVVAKKQVERANTAFLLAHNKHAEAQKRLAALTLTQQVGSTDTRDKTQDYLVRAPIQGVVAQADITLGAREEAGDVLFTVINLDQVWLEAHVYAADVPKISQDARASFLPQGMTSLILPNQANCRLVAIGNVIDPATKTLPVIFEVENADHHLKVGMQADVFIETEEKAESLIIPQTAILHESGKKMAFVQTGGETFEKRFLTTGITASLEGEDVVQILEGLKSGERVVTEGAYAIKLAGASGEIPVHAH